MSAGHPQDTQIRALYARYLAGWNQRSGVSVSSVFADDGEMIDLDGTLRSGRLTIAADMRRMFADHSTPAFVGVVRSVRRLTENVAVLQSTPARYGGRADALAALTAELEAAR